MTSDLKHLNAVQLKALLNHKKEIMDAATEAGEPQAILNKLYQEYKALQQELNLRKITYAAD